MNNISGRQYQILLHIYNSGEPISSDILATSIGVSSKTIKAEITVINHIIYDYGASIISKTGIGHTLSIFNYASFHKFLNLSIQTRSIHNSMPLIYQRAHYIVRRILSSNNSVTINQLADELFTSRTTINTDLIVVKEILNNYHITLKSKPHYGLQYDAQESAIRFCLIDEFYYYQSKNLFVNEDNYISSFSIDSKYAHLIKGIIFEQQKNTEFFEISYRNIDLLIQLIVVSYQRRKFSQNILFDESIKRWIENTFSFSYAKEIYKQCSHFFGYTFTENDIYTLAVGIVCCKNYSSINKVGNKNTYFERYLIAEDLIKYLCDINTFSSLQEDIDLIKTLTLHLMPLFNRCFFNVKLPIMNTLLVKQNSISSIELAAQTALYLKETHDIILAEEEIVFLAYVYHPRFGRHNRNTKKKSIILVNSIDKSIGKGLENRLMRNFSEHIEKIELLDFYELDSINCNDYDLLISDIHPDNLKNIKLPKLNIDIFFKQKTKSDISNILSMKKLNFEDMLNNFNREYFYTYRNIGSKKQFMIELEHNLDKHTNHGSEIINDIILRDKLSSIERGNKLGFLKTLHSHTDQSFISVNILDKPIIWKYEKVQLLIILHIAKDDYINIDFFENGYFGNVIRTIFFNEENITKLLKHQNYEVLLEIVKLKVSLSMLSM
ncbi:MAG: HTH domain-containing protein [Erysipelotrichaceae bacterium]